MTRAITLPLHAVQIVHKVYVTLMIRDFHASLADPFVNLFVYQTDGSSHANTFSC